MSFENAKRLYDFYMRTGQTSRAEELARKRPELVKEEKKTPKPKEKKEVKEDDES